MLYTIIALVCTFLAEITINPFISKSYNIIEYTTILYFVTLFRTHKNISPLIVSIVIYLADFISGETAGIHSFAFLFTAYFYQQFFTSKYRANRVLSKLQTNLFFAAIFAIITIIRLIFFTTLHIETTLLYHFTYFILNCAIFFTIIICI